MSRAVRVGNLKGESWVREQVPEDWNSDPGQTEQGTAFSLHLTTRFL